MKKTFYILIFLCFFSKQNFGQCKFDSTDIENINRLTRITVNLFIKNVNNPNSKSHKKVQEIFGDIKSNGRTQNRSDYTEIVNKKLIKTSFINFYYFNSIGSVTDSGYDGEYRTQGLKLFISIPYFDGIAMGYGINTITFLVNLEQIDKWKEEGDNETPIEKYPGYKVNYKLSEIKFIDTNAVD